jgi:UDP-glucose 4-epimerase
MKNRVLVTGGCGFIGTHVTLNLLSQGYQVHVVDDMSGCDPADFYAALPDMKVRQVPTFLVNAWEQQGAESEDADVVVFTGDFASGEIIRRVLQVKYDAVIHLAAEPRVVHTVNFPVSSYDNNLQSSIALFHACAKSSTRLVFASSAAVYGNIENVGAVREDMSPGMIGSPYALQKRQCEEVIELFSRLYNLSGVSLRFFNVYGEGQKGDSPYSTVIASWVERINSNKPLRLDGDGTQTRDYVHVTDVARACALAVESNAAGSINIASGFCVSNNEILSLLANYVQVEVEHAPPRVGDIKNSLAAVDKATELLDFKSVIDIHSGIAAIMRSYDG